MPNRPGAETLGTTFSPFGETVVPLETFNSSFDDIHTVIHILSLGQILCRQVKGSVTRLCQEVRHITRNRAQLFLQKDRNARRFPNAQQAAVTLPVQFGSTVYGSLSISADPQNSGQPAISLVVAQLLAQTCSWLLYMLEQSSFLQSQCRHLEYHTCEPLTHREHEVLELMFRGCVQEEIAEQLCIAPATVSKHRQHIYERLGVHNERDALLAAYHIGILSLLEDIIAHEEKRSE